METDTWNTCIELLSLFAKNTANLDYRYGMIHAREVSKDLAKTWLLLSVERNPWNWGAWLELSRLIVSKKEVWPHFLHGMKSN